MSIVSTICDTARKVGLVLYKNRSTIFTFTGVGLTVTGTVVACKATLKLPDIVDEVKENVDVIHEAEKTDDEKTKMLTATYAKAAWEVTKLYILPAAITVGGVGLIIGGHDILRKENFALAGAYATLREGFDRYRNRVREEYGEEKDYEYFNGLKRVGEREVINENGESETVAVYEPCGEPCGDDIGKILFDELNVNWNHHNPAMNMSYLRQAEVFLTLRLRARNHITVNEIREYLGKEPIPNGFIYGIVDHTGNGLVNFGIFDTKNHLAATEAMLESGNGVWINLQIDPYPITQTLFSSWNGNVKEISNE